MHWIDPHSLPATTGTVSYFLFNAHGDADGFMLDGNQQVHVPPHMSAQLLRAVRPGDHVKGRGLRPRGADVLAAVAIETSNGKVLVDDGPKPRPSPVRKRARRPIEVHSRVARTLFAPRGEVCGAVLESGDIIRMDPKANTELASFFRQHASIGVWGDAFKVRGRRVVDLTDVAEA